MSKTRQNWMKKSDILFSKLIRDRDQVCQAGGFDDVDCRGNLQCAHILGRGELSIRCSFDNAVALCQAHHLFYTHRPAHWLDFVDHRYPGRLADLRAAVRAHRELNGKIDWKLRHDTLKEMCVSLGVR